MRAAVATSALLAAIAHAGTALAQPGLAPPSATPAAAIEHGTDTDVSADRGFAAPTGLTQPDGTVGLAALQIGPVTSLLATIGVDHDLQLQGSYVSIMSEDEYMLGAMAKYRVHRGERSHVAVQVGFWSLDDGYDDSLVIVHGGVAATRCLDAGCRSLISGFAGSARAIDEEGQPLLLSGLAILALTDHIKLVGEVDLGFVDDDDGALVWGGARFTGRSFGVDLGVLSLPNEEAAIPTISLTYRGG